MVTPHDVGAMLRPGIFSEVAPKADPVIALRIFGNPESQRAGGCRVIKSIDAIYAAFAHRLHLVLVDPVELVLEPGIEIHAPVVAPIARHRVEGIAVLNTVAIIGDWVVIIGMPEVGVIKAESMPQFMGYHTEVKLTVDPHH